MNDPVNTPTEPDTKARPDSKPATRKRRWLRVLFIDVLIFLAVYLGMQWWLGRDIPEGQAPALSALTVKGETFSLQAPRDEPLLIHFWASWCSICRFEHDSIDSIAEDYPVITVMTRSGTEQEALKYLDDNKIQARVILDEEGELADSYNIRGVPATFIIRPDGSIADVEIGYSSELGLRARLWLASW